MYLSLVQVAESFGVAEKVVEDWIRSEALPHVPDRGRLLFDRAQIAEWAAARGIAAKAGFLALGSPTLATSWRLEPLLRAGGIWRDVSAASVTEVLVQVVARLPGASPAIRDLLSQRLRARGGWTTAPVGGGHALPHLSTRVALGRDAGTLALLLLRDALPATEAAPPDRVPITRLLFFVAPSPRAHLDLLGRLSSVLLHGPLPGLLARGASDAEILGAMAAGDAAWPVAAGREGAP